MTELDENEIKRKLYAYCAYQERCIQEVHQKLKSLEVAEGDYPFWVSHLREEKFLDEDRFARSYARGKFRYKRWGRLKIIRELRKRNIREGLIQSALRTEISQESYQETLQKLIQLRKLQFPLSPSERQKLSFFLSQKGFEWEEIRKALKTFEISRK